MLAAGMIHAYKSWTWVMALIILSFIALPPTQGFKIPLEHYPCPEDVPHCHDNDIDDRSMFMPLDRLPQEHDDPLFLGVLRSYVDALLEPLEKRDPEKPRTIPSLPEFCGLAPLGHALSVQRIVGGEEAKIGQFPWQAQLLVRKPQKNNRLYFQCGATLISDELLVTAAHCIKVVDASLYTVILGKHGYDSAPACDEQRFEVRKIVIHPQFNTRTLLNDITLLWIRTPWNQTARYTDYIQPACLPNADDRDLYLAGSVGQVSGWGLMDESDRTSAAHSLQHVGVPITSAQVCEDSYDGRVEINREKQFCAGNDKGQDACAGDSGGPFVRMVHGRITLVGVVSFGVGCGRKEYPGVYVKVQGFLGWIRSEIEKDREERQPTPTTTTTSTTTPTTTTTTRTTTSTTTSTTTTPPTTTTTTTTTTTLPPDEESDVEEVGPVCAGAFRYMGCDKDQKIQIVSAFYGRRDGHTCASGSARSFQSFTAYNCELDNVRYYLDKQCDGKTGCWLYHGLFREDPCPYLSKYAIIKYRCVDPSKIM